MHCALIKKTCSKNSTCPINYIVTCRKNKKNLSAGLGGHFMGFEPIYEKLAPAGFKRLCNSQAVVEARLLASGGVLISKVLSIAADCSVTAGDVFTGEARYSGRVSFKVLFTCKEGLNHSMDYNADFTDKLLCDTLKAGLKPFVSASILDVDIVAVDEREIKLACVVETSLDAVLEQSVDVLANGGEGIYTHTKKIEFFKSVNSVVHNFTLTDKVDLKGARVLLSEARAVVKNSTASFDSAIVEGNIVCDLTCEDSDGMIYSVVHTTPFKEELSCTDTRDNHFLIASASLANHAVTVESDNDKHSALLEFSLNGAAKVFSQETQEVIVDAFSVANELDFSGEEIAVCVQKNNLTFSDRVEGAVTLDANMPIADSILGLTGSKLHIASAVASEGRVTYEGMVSTNIIYFAAEGSVKNSVAVELPFSISTTLAGALDGDTILARGIVTLATAKLVRGNEISIKADIDVEVIASSEAKHFVLTNLNLGEERILSDAAFSVHMAKGGETLWDVAKSLGITPESVLEQNPSLELPLAGGERVMCYRQKK